MAEQIVNGVKLPDDEGKIIIPQGYADPIIVREHIAVIGENTITCNFTVMDPLKHVGETVTCPNCGQKFVITMQGAEPEKK